MGSNPTSATSLGRREQSKLMTDSIEETSEHLIHTFSKRGFKHMPELHCDYGSEVRVYESSAAVSPFIWLDVKHRSGSGTAHMTLDDAARLRDQLDYLIAHHYQLPADDEDTDGECTRV